uniref:SWI/SNF-like complex subunit BAF250 C-terminal domain-containing protein n=1 Tax=Ciona intestinalis TaxID=7719 RepID=F6U2A4_CIOIN
MLRSDNLFPPDSVEATQPKNFRFQRKSCRDVGVLEGWKVIMALKSGLLVESTWALNVLTVLLYDQQTIAQFKLVQLPGLLDALVEHYRRCLSAIFTLSSEQQALGVANFDPTPHPEVKDALEDETADVPTKMKTNKGHQVVTIITYYGGNRPFPGQANAKLYGVFSELPIKVEPRTDPFVVDRTHQWDFANKVISNNIDLSDDLSHIIVSFQQSTEATQVEHDEITEPEQPIRVVEATLEDVLSIPCSVLAPEDDDVIDDVTTHDVMTDNIIKDIKKEVAEKSEDIPETKTNNEKIVANGTDENEKMDVCDVIKRQAEVSRRLECLSNIIRGLSFVPGNANELCRQRELMRALSGTLLLRHKHRTRPRHASPHSESATVLDSDENTEVYTAPWWWDTVRRVREDSLVILSNIAHSVDLSELPDDHVAMAVLEACLHWSVCPSSDASDSFSSSRSRRMLSPQRLALEILTKLSIKDQNVDLILATRPFSRIEKLFGYLVNLICDRKDQTLREFAIVLIANLAGGDTVAARAIALQKGAISGLISFLEECEETGMSNRRMFSAVQQNINCGTIEFMMIKCSTTILCLAKLDENRSSFVKYQLRLLSLSMSQILDPKVVRIMSSVLYELSHD